MVPLEIARLVEDSYGDLPQSLRMIDRFIGWAPKYVRDIRHEAAQGSIQQARQKLRWLSEAARFLRAGRLTLVVDSAIKWPARALRSDASALGIRLASEVKAIVEYRATIKDVPARPRLRYAEEIIPEQQTP
jgi:hypothetical protein